MPSWQSFDAGFPSFTGEESAKEQIEKIHNYLFQMRQGLQFTLETMSKRIGALEKALKESNNKS